MIIEDLTEFSNSGASGSGLVRLLQQSDVTHFDMSCTDDGNVWTCSPTFQDEPNRLHHVRMMSFAGVSSAEIILDSGADTSALPLTTLMLVNHVSMKQLDQTSLMRKVESLTYVTQDLQLLTLAMA